MRTKCDKSYVGSFIGRRFQRRGKIIDGKRNIVYPMRGHYPFPLMRYDL